MSIPDFAIVLNKSVALGSIQINTSYDTKARSTKAWSGRSGGVQWSGAGGTGQKGPSVSKPGRNVW